MLYDPNQQLNLIQQSTMNRSNKTQENAQLTRKWTCNYLMLDELVLMQSQDQEYQVDLFNHLLLQYVIPSSVKLVEKQQTQEETPSPNMLSLISQYESQEQDKMIQSVNALERSANKIEVSQQAPNRKGCACTNSKCQKAYCECYRMGNVCAQGVCGCRECQNIEVKSVHQQLQKKWFKKMSQQVKGCKCQKSKCLKKYCQCYSNGKKCGALCECVQCFNHDEKEDYQYECMSKKRKMTSSCESNGYKWRQ